MPNKVLLPFDGSPSSVKAAHYIAREFRNRDASVLLLNVQQVYLDAELATMGRSLMKALHADGQAALREGVEILDRAGIAHEARIRIGFGPVAKAIALVAKEAGVGLIVMGTRARHPLVELITRAVPARVLRASEVPVVLVKRGARTKTSKYIEPASIAA